MSETQKFESWAVVELFGHQRIAGLVTEATIGGCSFVRVDVPEQPEIPASQWNSARPALPAYTRYFGQGAIYALNPCSEEGARYTASEIRARPPIAYLPPTMEQQKKLSPPAEGALTDADYEPCDEHGLIGCEERHR